MRRAVLSVLSVAALVCLAAPREARALPWASANLQSCEGNKGDLPIGGPADPGHAWKKTIVEWLAKNQAQDFAWKEPLTMQGPPGAYNAGSSPNGNLCSFGTGPGQALPPPWPGVGAAEKLHIEQFWLLASSFFVPWAWFGHDPAIFTLDEMKDEPRCKVRTPGMAWGDSLAFFASWQYAGSPFRPGTANNKALKLRLAAWLGLQLAVLDYAHYGGTGTFTPGSFPPSYPPQRFAHPPAGLGPWSDMTIGAELAGQLALLAWTFGHVRGILPPHVDAAMREALLTYAERVSLWNPYFPQTNRGIRAAYALRYVAEVTQDTDAQQRYIAALKQFFHPSGGNWIEGGYWRDDYGLDLGYGGACLMAADRTLSEDPAIPTFVRDSVAESHELIAHLALRDRDGRWTAPQAFNSRTSSGSIRGVAPHVREGYYGGLERYVLGYAEGMPYAAASLRDVEVLGPQGTMALDPRVLGFHEHLGCLGAGYAGYITTGLQTLPNTIDSNVDARGQGDWPNLTRSQDWGPPPTYIENHHLGVLVDLWDELQNFPSLALMPIEEPGTKIRSFGDRFVYGRFDGTGPGTTFAAVLHVGEVGQLLGGGESGLGGGQLASFWTPEGGPTLLSRRKGRNTGLPGSDDDWAEWRTFPIHAVTLRTAAGRVSSSALIAAPTTSVYPLAQAPAPGQIADALAGTGLWTTPTAVPDHQADAALAYVSGSIPALAYGESGGLGASLQQPIAYRRAFLISDEGIWVRSSLGASAGGELLTEAWETIPAWNRDVATQTTLTDTQIKLYTSLNAQPIDASQGTPAPVPGIVAAEVRRAQGVTRISFDQARRVAVSALWSLGTQQSRTLMIDRLPAGCPNTGCALQPEVFEYLIEEI